MFSTEKKNSGAEVAVCLDIPSHEKIPNLGIKNPLDIPKIKNSEKIPNPGDFHSGFFRDFHRMFSGFSNSDPHPQDFRDISLRIFSGFVRGFNISITIPEISGFSGFFTRNFPEFQIPIPGISGFSGFGIRDPEKIPSRSKLCFWRY